MVAGVESLNWNRNICRILHTHTFLLNKNRIEILFISTRGRGGGFHALTILAYSHTFTLPHLHTIILTRLHALLFKREKN